MDMQMIQCDVAISCENQIKKYMAMIFFLVHHLPLK